MSGATRHPAETYDFQPLVRELLESTGAPLRPGDPGLPEDERIRFCTNPSMGFPTSEIESIAWGETPGGEPRATVMVNFMGLLGTASPLPLHYVQEVLWEMNEPEGGARVRDFLDLFDHRMISFMFRAREKYRYALRFSPDGRDEFTERLLALAGLDEAGIRAQAGLPLQKLLRGFGLLTGSRRSAAGLEELLHACFPGVGVAVTCCVPRRMSIPEDQRLFLSAPRRTTPRREETMTGLGRDTCIGTSRVDASSAFRVALGPMGHDNFRRFLPGESDFGELTRLIRLYVKDPLDFDIELHLEPAERPAVALDPGAGLRLGQTTWLTPTDAHEGVTRLRAPRPDASQQPSTRAA